MPWWRSSTATSESAGPRAFTVCWPHRLGSWECTISHKRKRAQQSRSICEKSCSKTVYCQVFFYSCFHTESETHIRTPTNCHRWKLKKLNNKFRSAVSRVLDFPLFSDCQTGKSAPLCRGKAIASAFSSTFTTNMMFGTCCRPSDFSSLLWCCWRSTMTWPQFRAEIFPFFNSFYLIFFMRNRSVFHVWWR